MKHGTETLPNESQDLGIRSDARAGAGEVFPANEDGLHGLGFEKGARTLIARDGDGLVGGVGEPVGVDDGGVLGVGRGNGDDATGERCDQHGGDGGVVVAVGGCV